MDNLKWFSEGGSSFAQAFYAFPNNTIVSVQLDHKVIIAFYDISLKIILIKNLLTTKHDSIS